MNERLKVLIVDDEPINLDILDEMLGEKCETCLADSGEAGLKKVETFKPDLVLLDVMMPGIDGFETCKILRTKPEYSDLKIIMISARAEQKDIDLGLQAGADEYVSKPFDEATLVEVINRNI